MDIQVRIGIQCCVGVVFILGIFSTPAVWEGFSMNTTFVTPQLLVIFFNVVMLSRLIANLPAGKILAYAAAGAALGSGLALGAVYITYAANGGSYQGSATKAAVLLVLTAPAVFVVTLLRFKQRPRLLAYMFATLVLTSSAAGMYRTPPGAPLYPFPLWYAAYLGLAGVAATLVATLVVPVTSGLMARRSLAASLDGLGGVVAATMQIYTAPLDAHGRLEMATGLPVSGRAIDQGVLGAVEPIHQKAAAAGNAIQAAHMHIAAARWEVDVYRPTRLLPVKPFATIAMLSRVTLSTATLLLYPVETGTLRLQLCAAHAGDLRAAAAALEECCSALGRTLRANAPILPALQAFEGLHQQMAGLSACVGEYAHPLAGGFGQEAVSFHTVTSILFTLYTRLRRMLTLLPAALARDQPGARALVRQRLLQLPACQAALPSQHRGREEGPRGRASLQDDAWPWQPGQRPSRQGGAWEVVRGSLLSRASVVLLEGLERLAETSSSSPEAAGQQQLLARLVKRSVEVAEVQPQPSSLLQTWLDWVNARTGFTAAHMRVGIQLVVAYVAVMFLEIITPVYDALGQRAVWAMLIVVVLQEATAGSSLFKASLRLLGTLIGAAVGFGVFYFAILCNGLSHANHPQKFILTALLLAAFSGVCGWAAAGAPRYTYMFMTSTIIASGVSLLGYTLPDVLWHYGLWRLALTGIGLAINFLAVTFVLPVTTRDVLQGQVAAALGQLAAAAEATIVGALPPPAQQQGQPRAEQGDGGGWVDGGSGRGSGSSSKGQGVGARTAAPHWSLASLQLGALRASSAEEPPAEAAPFEGALPPAGPAILELSPAASDAGSTIASAAHAILTPFVSREQEHQRRLSGGSQPEGRRLGSTMPGPQPSAAQGSIGSQGFRGLGSVQSTKHVELAQQQKRQGTQSSAALPPRHMSLQATLVLIDADYGASAGACSGLAPEGWRRQGAAVAGFLRRVRRRWWEQRASLPALVQRDCERRLHAALGPSYLKLFKLAHTASALVSGMVPLIPSLVYEYYPFRRPHRLDLGDAAYTQRTLRQLLNVLSSFAAMLDAHGLVHVALLGVLRPQAVQAAHQLGAALRAVQAAAQGRLRPERAAEVVQSFGAHVQKLFLLTILAKPPDHPDSAQGLAFMAMLFSLASVVHMLCLSVVKTFYGGGSKEAQAVERALGSAGPAGWSLDDRLLATATEVLGLAMGPTDSEGEEADGEAVD